MFEYCPGCDDVIEAGEPCECVFVARGWVDAQGVLHTAKRVSMDGAHVLDGRAGELAEFPYGEFDHGAHWCEPAAQSEPSRWDWLNERCGDPDDECPDCNKASVRNAKKTNGLL